MILVADDDPRMRGVVAAIVAQRFPELGDVVTAADGAAALAACDIQTPRLIVSDVQMPHLLGPVFVAQVEAKHGRLPTVFMSAEPGCVPRSAYVGHPVLTKPFGEATLIAAIEAELPV